jgi:hypothetical protein
MLEAHLSNDAWNYATEKMAKAPTIVLPDIYGILPFDGVRNPGFLSSTSHHIWFNYRTEANGWKPKVGICESGGEFAVALEGLLDPTTYDIRFQPFTVYYDDPETGQKNASYTHDILITRRDGHRRLIFVRFAHSLSKEKVWRSINRVAEATKRAKIADSMVIKVADEYSKQRRENLFRMWQEAKVPDQEADELVLDAAMRCRSLWFMKDLFPLVGIAQKRTFAACYRLIAQKQLHANLDNVIWENSRIAVQPWK